MSELPPPPAPPAPAPLEPVEPEPTPSEGDAIRTFGLTKVYGDLFAVNRLDLRVPVGSVFGLVGPNGAGKTTTFSMLASLLLPSGGQALVAGHDPAKHPREVRRRVGYMPDMLGVYDGLRVDEYLRFFAASYGVASRSHDGLVDGLLELVDLRVKRDAMVNSLSRGMKQRLSLARALVHDPELLILDEPASGLDPRARIELRELIAELRSMGKTIVISSHILSELEEICTDVGIIEAGRLLAQGPPKQILRQVEATRTILVRFADGEEVTLTVHDDLEQVQLLHRLVAEQGRPVIEFREVGGGLEDVFMRVTKGIVQ
jgi:ABC-2 type transport system ATP-binding protein